MSVSTFFSYSICMQFAKLDYRHFLRKGKKKKKDKEKTSKFIPLSPTVCETRLRLIFLLFFTGNWHKNFPCSHTMLQEMGIILDPRSNKKWRNGMVNSLFLGLQGCHLELGVMRLHLKPHFPLIPAMNIKWYY